MSQQAAVARTPGATRAGDGEYVFDLANVNHILGGPDYSTANGACVEGDRMIVGLMRMPAGTGAEPHSHPNEQWIYILQGTFRGTIGDTDFEARAGSVVYVPANAVHSGKATPDADVVFFTCKDASHSLHGIKAQR
jgi:mannose-6-phosphate isomerase-like protein (cupin superfamily)